MKSLKARRIIGNTIVYIILGISAIIWVLPILWLFFQAFASEIGSSAMTKFLPSVSFSENGLITGVNMTFDNFLWLFGAGSPPYAAVHSLDGYFLKWMGNTMIVAVLTTIIATLFVLSTAYALSRFRFKGRQTLMKLNLVLGMFPGFLGMIILYWVMKVIFHLQGSYWALVIIYSAGTGMGFFISKGFFDTISRSIDEAAMIDGANRAEIFWNIILPLSKPIVVYTILTSFMAPWGDYITSSYIIGLQNTSNWTVAIGLYKWATDTTTYQQTYYTQYAAGSVVVAIPIAVLFICMQNYYVSGVTGGAVKG